MNWILERMADPLAQGIVSYAVHLTLGATVVLAGAWIAEWACTRASAGDRHRLWAVAGVVGVLVPLLAAIWPGRGVDLLPQREVGDRRGLVEGTAPTGEAPATEVGVADGAGVSPGGNPAGTTAISTAVVSAAVPGVWSLPMPKMGLAKARWVSGLICLGALAGFGQILRQWLGLRRMLGESTVVTDREWTEAWAHARAEMGVRRRVELRSHSTQVVPVTWGHVRPVVLIPGETSGWSAGRRKAVLLHELAHVRRWDCSVQRLLEILRALSWFHPLGWVALGRLRREREHACDDLVLGRGVKASDYAEHLVEIAHGAGGPASRAAIAMADAGRLSARVAAILDSGRRRRGVPGYFVVLASVLGLALGSPRPVLRAAEAGVEATEVSPVAKGADTEGDSAKRSREALRERLAESVDEVRREVARLERSLDEFRERQGITDISPGMDSGGGVASQASQATLEARLAEMRLETQARMVRLQARLEMLKKLPSTTILSAILNESRDDRLLQHLAVLQATASVDLAVAEVRWGPGHPERQAAAERVRVLNEKVDAAVASVLQGLEIQIEVCRNELKHIDLDSADLHQRAAELAPVYREYFQKKRHLENQRIILDVLTRRWAGERFEVQAIGAGAVRDSGATP